MRAHTLVTAWHIHADCCTGGVYKIAQTQQCMNFSLNLRRDRRRRARIEPISEDEDEDEPGGADVENSPEGVEGPLHRKRVANVHTEKLSDRVLSWEVGEHALLPDARTEVEPQRVQDAEHRLAPAGTAEGKGGKLRKFPSPGNGWGERKEDRGRDLYMT
eukprot:920533-Rhodomonas_salina.2